MGVSCICALEPSVELTDYDNYYRKKSVTELKMQCYIFSAIFYLCMCVTWTFLLMVFKFCDLLTRDTNDKVLSGSSGRERILDQYYSSPHKVGYQASASSWIQNLAHILGSQLA